MSGLKFTTDERQSIKAAWSAVLDCAAGWTAAETGRLQLALDDAHDAIGHRVTAKANLCHWILRGATDRVQSTPHALWFLADYRRTAVLWGHLRQKRMSADLVGLLTAADTALRDACHRDIMPVDAHNDRR